MHRYRRELERGRLENVGGKIIYLDAPLSTEGRFSHSTLYEEHSIHDVHPTFTFSIRVRNVRERERKGGGEEKGGGQAAAAGL